MSLYIPDEDSLLLLHTLEPVVNGTLLEIGVGTGFLIERLAGRCQLAVGTDLNLAALLMTRNKVKDDVELIQCDTAEAIRDSSFEYVYFNPPYLPGDYNEDMSIFGGADGSEIAIKMLLSSVRVANLSGNVYFVVSSLTESDRLFKAANKFGVLSRISVKKLFFEVLTIYWLKFERKK